MNQGPYSNPYAPPQAGFGVPAAGFASQGAIAVHVEGKLLVAQNGTNLPPMCLKCGAQPTQWKRQRYQYTPPWAFLVLGWIGILAFSKRSTFQVPLCDAHLAAWKKWNVLAALSWLPGLALFIAGSAADAPGIGAVGLGMCAIGLIAALVLRTRRIVMPTKIDATQTWLRGVHPSVLQAVAAPGMQPAALAYPAPPPGRPF